MRPVFSIDKRQKRSRKRDDDDQGDITWINEQNRQFNRKLSRYYDDVTRETRENFERGKLTFLWRGSARIDWLLPPQAPRSSLLSTVYTCARFSRTVCLYILLLHSQVYGFFRDFFCVDIVGRLTWRFPSRSSPLPDFPAVSEVTIDCAQSRETPRLPVLGSARAAAGCRTRS